MKKLYYLFGVLTIGLLLVLFGVGNFNKAGASAPSGLSTTVVLVENTTVGPDFNTLLFTSNDRCTSRVISTKGQAIMLNFATTSAQATSTAYLSSMKGNIQLASTTVAYDSGIYGCGAVGAYGVVSSTTITTSEFR